MRILIIICKVWCFDQHPEEEETMMKKMRYGWPIHGVHKRTQTYQTGQHAKGANSLLRKLKRAFAGRDHETASS